MALMPFAEFGWSGTGLVICGRTQASLSSAGEIELGWGGRRAGTLGDVGLLSCGPTKQISTGDAALLVRDGTIFAAPDGSFDQCDLANRFSERQDAVFDVIMLPNVIYYLPRRSLEFAGPASSDTCIRAESCFPENPHAEDWGYGRGAGGRALGAVIGLTAMRRAACGRYACGLPGVAWSEQHRSSTVAGCGMSSMGY